MCRLVNKMFTQPCVYERAKMCDVRQRPWRGVAPADAGVLVPVPLCVVQTLMGADAC